LQRFLLGSRLCHSKSIKALLIFFVPVFCSHHYHFILFLANVTLPTTHEYSSSILKRLTAYISKLWEPRSKPSKKASPQSGLAFAGRVPNGWYLFAGRGRAELARFGSGARCWAAGFGFGFGLFGFGSTAASVRKGRNSQQAGYKKFGHGGVKKGGEKMEF
jgi:hypothetical protein